MRRRRPVERVELELERYGNDPDEWVARVNVVEAERGAPVLDFPVAGYGPGAPGEVLEEVGQRLDAREAERAAMESAMERADRSAFDR
jgi:hypothetical protein